MTQVTKINIDLSKVKEFEEAKETQEKLVKENPFIPVVDNESYEEAKKRRTALVRGRTSIEKGDKAIASKLREFRASVKERSEELIAITKPHEEKQQEAINPWEEEKEKERKEREEKKAAEMAAYLKKAQDILKYTDQLVNPENVKTVKAIINLVEDVVVDEETFGPYILIGEQNKAKILEQAKAVEARMIDQEQIEEQRKAEELANARSAYKDYIGEDADESHTAKQLQSMIDIVKEKKLKRLEELEAKEKERKAAEQAAADYRAEIEIKHNSIFGIDKAELSAMSNEAIEADLKKHEEFEAKDREIEKDMAKAQAEYPLTEKEAFKNIKSDPGKDIANAIPPSKEQTVLKVWREHLKEVLSNMPSFQLKDNPEMLKGMYESAELVKKAIENLNKFI